jgi:hypothetical protein
MALRKMYFVAGNWSAQPILRAEPDRPPQVKADRPPPPPVKRTVGKTKRVAKTRRAAKRKRVAKIKRLAKYIHPTDKWIALRTKLRETILQEEGLVRAKMADFMHKTLLAYTAEHVSNTASSNKSHIRL